MAIESKRNQPVLVAGSAGFLGSHLCDRLVQRGFPLLCIDNLVTGDRRNILHLTESTSFTIQRHDLCDQLEAEGVGAIFNLACPAAPIHYQADPIGTTMTSVRGAYNLLEIARQQKVTMLHASTSEVYGDPSIHPQSESYWGYGNPTGLRACYDEGKRCAESLCFDYQRQHAVDVRVVRIFNTYGPGMQVGDGRVVSNFIVQALLNQPITVYGKGEQTRSFCYVDDLIDGLLTFMDAPHGVPSPMNLGNPEEFTIMELAELIIGLTGSRSRTVFLPLPRGDPAQRCPNIELARSQLGWQPRVSLRDGLTRTIGYFEYALQCRRPAAHAGVAARGKRKPAQAQTESVGRAPPILEISRVRH
jgi:UDP-glucuronate decarboxylase